MVLVAVGACEIGIMAEAVIENFPMTATCLDAATRGRSYLGSCIQGLCEMGNRIIILLDIARVFSPEELAVLHKLNSRLAD
ncbi:hypothetical protein SDC9_196013 [bioreactor metagenome]|uniref:CheW-like domain-containing protein n=1 Tax=bioreactor metagenome TaxID=1076179 RepID=A0A645IBV6_9ZZZZ